MFDAVELAEYRRDYDAEFLSSRSEVIREVDLEDDGAGQTRKKPAVIARLRGRIRTESDSQAKTEGERVTTVSGWKIELSLADIASVKHPGGCCFRLQIGDRLRVQGTHTIYEFIGADPGRSEAPCLTATCKRIGS